jgi:hypothetical protein
MIGPIQNSPLPLEPARQQLAPPSPLVTQPPQPPSLAEQPLPPSTTPRDKFSGKEDGGGADRDSARQQQQQDYETNKALNSAWVRLTALQHIAREALSAGNGPAAKQAAVEAASVAASIRNIADSLPGVSVDGIDVPAAIDNARGGLGAALDVVDLAGKIRHHPVEDREAIGGAHTRIIDAIAGVEAVAAQLLPSTSRPLSQDSHHLDLTA